MLMALSVSTVSPTTPPTTGDLPRVGLFHGAGYVGGELIRLIAGHPSVTLASVTSRTFAGSPVSDAHPHLRGQVVHDFLSPEEVDIGPLDAIVLAGEHGQSMHLVPELLDAGFDGLIVDLSADFRFSDASLYRRWYDVEHPAPELLGDAQYGLPEWESDLDSARLVANPGCYATGIALALGPLAAHGTPFSAHVTALTGASGSGATPSPATHFPHRDGNVRPYKVLDHQHTPEIRKTIGDHVELHFVPASGPWSRGIWGTAHVEWPRTPSAEQIGDWFHEAYADAAFVRCLPGECPSLRPTVGTPFCDVGWTRDGDTIVVGFALDNLLKGAASQAIQNLNRALGRPEGSGLLPQRAPSIS